VWNLEVEGVEKPAQVRVPGSFAGQDELWGKEHWDVWDYPKDWRNKPATYVRSIEVPENLGNRRVLIHIGGVRHVVKVTVNGKEGFEATSVGPRTEPRHPWRLDNLPAGNNDFCSTKHSVRQASLSDGKGSIFSIEGEGQTHIRCWKSATGIRLLVANFSHGGAENFLKSFTKRSGRPLKKGQTVTGSVKING
jgi:hypothetical protein